MLIVTTPFSGHGYDMPRAGTLIDPAEPYRSALLAAGCVAEYECKVQPLPAEIKKKTQSELSQADLARLLQMRGYW